ncbi:leucine-rich repeat-containing protein 9-like isoform X2 [Mytilus galloprovincialis]|uniref:leucine-rich repeat-containing protein 9-like isoform X2 n=1 Tax=Mytilus galloprovincialis TaxID=29158 RepID=UPI003F7BAEEC
MSVSTDSSGPVTNGDVTPSTISTEPSRSNKDEEDDCMKELCANNGINYSKIQNGDICNVDKLEMFFSGYPKIIGMHLFPSLSCLVIMDQQVAKIEGLSTLVLLRELWICDCQVKKIENLEANKNLRKLYLYGNKIEVIEHLNHLGELEILWLNDNCIVNIENISMLSKLKQLNLAENKITRIGHTLDSNKKLEDLNLSGNNITSLRELTQLMRLPTLQSLSLKDPMYTPAPVSLLCNYSTHVLFHLPTLNTLDTYDVSKTVTDVAEATVMKKRMYYHMRVKTVHRNMTDILTKMDVYKTKLEEFPHERIKSLYNVLKEIETELEDTWDLNVDLDFEEVVDLEKMDIATQAKAQKLEETGGFVAKHTCLKERIRKWERKCHEIECYYNEAAARIKKSADVIVNRMLIELESGGNVRFEEGSPTDIWFSSCHDLVLSRFCASDYKDHNVSGIKIHRIIRIHNRMLRTRFDDILSSIVDDPDGEYYPCNRNTGYRKLLEYLFWMQDPQLSNGANEPGHLLEEGFLEAQTYSDLGRDGAVSLSNSLSLADRHRIEHLTKNGKNSDYSDSCPFRYGQLVISKVYLGKSVKALDDRQISKSSYPKIDAVFKPRKMCISNEGDTLCECSARQCEWYLFDNRLVLPEYVVEFEYVTKFRSKSPFSYFNDMLLDNRECRLPAVPHADDDKSADDDVINMEPQCKPRPRLIALTEELVLKLANVDSMSSITSLNLHGNALSKLKPIHSLHNLKRLVVSGNELTKLDELSNMCIEYLDVSFNKLCTLDGLKNVHKLKFLDLSWNKLCNTREDLSILRKHVPNLLILDTRHNNWQKPENLRLRIIGRLKSLTLLDGSCVSETEATGALRIAAGSRISHLSLLTHTRTDNNKPRSLSLLTTPHILEKISRSKPEKMNEHDSHWFLKVTSLNLDKQHLTKLSGLEKLENLKWASFADNDLTKIEGLENCLKLHELYLDNNCLSKLEGIGKLIQLRRLSLDSNYISTLENTGIQFLTGLSYLSLENNKIVSLAGVQKLMSLVELYVGNNILNSVREIFFLKTLPNLVIIDLYGNPVVHEMDNYRLFIIYHLKTLKALDGLAIEATEGSIAKDTFGGRLTPDFVAEKLGHSNFEDVRELDLPNSAIRIVDLGLNDTFLNLRSVNLEHNNLTSFSGLIHLPNLRVLCLNHNHIECIMPRSKPQQTKRVVSTINNNRAGDFFNNNSTDSMTPVMESLEVLHLGYNNIKDMAALQLGRLTSLKALFLQGNEILKVEGLEGLHDLRELVLDRNKIKNIFETSFINQWNLQELHIEENRIRDLSNLHCLEHLQRLYLGSNRVQEISELEKLDSLVNMIEISLVNNPAARRHLHRPLLVFRLKQLMVIDGIPVNEEERTKAELYYMDQQQVNMVEGTLPGISQYKTQVPVKVTTMHLGSSPIWNGGAIYDENTPESLQRGGGRRRGNSKTDNGTGVLNRGNTIVAPGYGGMRHYLNQIPYVTPPSQSEINQAKNNKR